MTSLNSSIKRDLTKTCRYLLTKWKENPSKSITPLPLSHSLERSTNGFKQLLDAEGPENFALSIRSLSYPLLCDTTLRDAHQSLLATRMRTADMLSSAGIYRNHMSGLFSVEMWGGATYDVALRYLHEDPWERVRRLRSLIPNIPFQMLLRGTNAVGYMQYPHNVLSEFCKEAVSHGIDIFRLFDALNDPDNLQRGIDAVGVAGGVIEGAVCYTTDKFQLGRYTEDYFMNVVQHLVQSGVHIVAIKDMAGLLTPTTITRLVKSIRVEYPSVPLHIHTHDTAGTGVATLCAAVAAGADIVDVAVDSLSGLTSQPSMGAIISCLGNDLNVTLDECRHLNRYFRQVRSCYAEFDCGPIISSSDPDVFVHQIPGGQLSNLHVQSQSVGNDWNSIISSYSIANCILNDPIKVTPTSKAVGDFAQFIVSSGLDKQKVLDNAEVIDLPQSVLDFLIGKMGQPPFGFPEPFRSRVLSRLSSPETDGNEPDVEWERVETTIKTFLEEEGLEGLSRLTKSDLISFCIFPNVFKDFLRHRHRYGPFLSELSTPIFFHGLAPGESVNIIDNNNQSIQIARRPGLDHIFEINRTDVIKFDNEIGSYQEGGCLIEETNSSDNIKPFRVPLSGKVVAIHAKIKSKLNPQIPLMTIQIYPSSLNLLLTSPSTVEVLRLLVKEGDTVDPDQIVAELHWLQK